MRSNGPMIARPAMARACVSDHERNHGCSKDKECAAARIDTESTRLPATPCRQRGQAARGFSSRKIPQYRTRKIAAPRTIEEP